MGMTFMKTPKQPEEESARGERQSDGILSGISKSSH